MRRIGMAGLVALVLGVMGSMPSESRAQGIVIGTPGTTWGGGWNVGIGTGWYRPVGWGWTSPGYGWGWGGRPVWGGPVWSGPGWGAPVVVSRPLPYPVVGYPPYPSARYRGGHWRYW